MGLELSAVVVAYNSADGIGATVDALESALSHLSFEILVVDNASTDDTAAVAASHLRHGRVVALPENIGYAPGANVGLRHAQGRLTLIMNDDVSPEPNCIDQLIEVLDSGDDIGLVGAAMVGPDGNVLPSSRRYLPGWGDEWARINDWVRHGRSRLSPLNDSGRPADVELLIAAFVISETELLRSIGGFNDVFFLYGEDIDLCRRLRMLGYRRVLVPSAVAIHRQAVSPERRLADRSFSERILKARDQYYRIWLSRASRMLLNAYRAIGISDQPYRFRFHGKRILYDGPSEPELRRPAPLQVAHQPGGDPAEAEAPSA